jgi:hypothetical protein
VWIATNGTAELAGEHRGRDDIAQHKVAEQLRHVPVWKSGGLPAFRTCDCGPRFARERRQAGVAEGVETRERPRQP